MFIASVMPSSHVILWHPLFLLHSICPSIKDFSNESSVSIRWTKYWCFSFSINSSSEYTGLISLKIHWFDLSTVQETCRNFLQHHSSKASIVWHSAFFTVQLSQLYMTTGPYCLDYTDLCWQSDVSTYQHTVQICHSFPAKKQSSSDLMAAVTIHSDFRAQEEEICHYLRFFPFYLPCSNGAGCHDLRFFNI